MIVTLDAKRRLTVPAALAPTKPGDYFEARFDEDEDTIVFRRIKRGKGTGWRFGRKCPVPWTIFRIEVREYPKRPRL